MLKRQFGFKAEVQVVLEHVEGTKSNLKSTEMMLYPSGNLNESLYLRNGGKDGPTKEGCDAITMTLVAGIVGNIHYAHDNKMIDSAAHLRKVIDMLETGFVALSDAKTDQKFTDLSKLE